MTNITACELDYYSPILLFLDPSRAVFPPLPPDHWPRRLAGHLKFHLTVYITFPRGDFLYWHLPLPCRLHGKKSKCVFKPEFLEIERNKLY
jgi:hypothetical protein